MSETAQPGAFPGVDDRSCQLLGPTALVVQALMGVLVILSLVYKRHRETPHRPWWIWIFDVSKQLVGQAFVHGVNVLVSDLASRYTVTNGCVFYFLNILVDTTLGIGIIYVALHIMTYVLSDKLHLKGFESGQYGSPPSFVFWIKQATIYVLALIFMKFLVLGILILCPWLFKVAEWLLSWTYTSEGDALQVIFTMGIFPIIMNVLQFWLIDSIVKASASVSLSDDSSDVLDDSSREPLFGVSSDDEDNDEPHRSRDIENQNRYRSRSPSPSPRTKTTASSIEEPKLTSHNLTNTSGSNSGPDENSIAMHAYPPSLSSSMTSNHSSRSQPLSSAAPIQEISRSHSQPPRNTSKTKLGKRAVVPAPLNIRSAFQPAINSPAALRTATPTKNLQQTMVKTKPKIPAKTIAPENVDPNNNNHTTWSDSWDDGNDADDWANRVGEEEWTGKRIGETKEGLGFGLGSSSHEWDSRDVVAQAAVH